MHSDLDLPQLSPNKSVGFWNRSNSHVSALQALSSMPWTPMETQVHTYIYSSLTHRPPVFLTWARSDNFTSFQNSWKYQQSNSHMPNWYIPRIYTDVQHSSSIFHLKAPLNTQFDRQNLEEYQILSQNWNQNSFHQAPSNEKGHSEILCDLINIYKFNCLGFLLMNLISVFWFTCHFLTKSIVVLYEAISRCTHNFMSTSDYYLLLI